MSAHPVDKSKSAIFDTRQVMLAMLFGVAYWALRRYCLSLPVADSTISYIWLPDGLALGALLCLRWRQWPPYLLAMLLIGLVDTRRAFGPALLAIGLNILEPVLVAAMIKRLLGTPPRIDSVKGVTALFFCTIPLMAGATLLSASIDWFASPGHYWQVWRIWVVADTLGMLLVAPFVVAWFGSGAPGEGGWRASRATEAALAFGGLAIATHLAYSMNEPYGKGVTIAVFTLAFLIWTALRFGMRGATLASMMFAMQSFWYTANGLGHFARNFSDANESAVALQVYLVLSVLIALLSAALMSERQRANAESVDWRRRYESALAASHSLMYEVAPRSRAFTWGGNVEKVLGVARQNIPTAEQWIARVHPEDRHLLAGLRERFASGEINSVEREYRLRRDDGSYVHVGVTAYGITGDEETGKPKAGPVAPLDVRVVGFIRDISDRKGAEFEKRSLEDRLKQSEKMEAIGRFADGIAHDFNNILGAILGYGELAKGKAPAGSDIRRYLDTIQSAGERGRSLVAQILTFSRARPADKRPLLVAELVEEVTLQLEGSLPERISIRVVNESPGAVVLGEATQLHQLMMNLCTNAVQAMPEGGEVRLSVRAIRIDAARSALLGTLRPANYVELEVLDTGLGMDGEMAARIFEPFFTTKPVGQGTGLGLSLVRSIVLEHDGALDIVSAPGRGTRISTYLFEAAGGWEKPAVPDRELPRGSGETVMVIDDESALAAMAQEMLAELGYEAIAFTSSTEALAAYERDPARFDAILSDELMPQLTGTQIAARLREARASLPILIISGYGGPDFEVRAREAGVDRLLRKPYQKRELAEALASLLASKR
jgi:PAS domain S-box-containing protein